MRWTPNRQDVEDSRQRSKTRRSRYGLTEIGIVRTGLIKKVAPTNVKMLDFDSLREHFATGQQLREDFRLLVHHSNFSFPDPTTPLDETADDIADLILCGDLAQTLTAWKQMRQAPQTFSNVERLSIKPCTNATMSASAIRSTTNRRYSTTRYTRTISTGTTCTHPSTILRQQVECRSTESHFGGSAEGATKLTSASGLGASHDRHTSR